MTAYCYGDDGGLIRDYGWCRWHADYEPKAVGQLKPNAWGLHDMHGNVWEWCQDLWHPTYEGAPSDQSVWDEGGDRERRVIRGGAFPSQPVHCRSAYRFGVKFIHGDNCHGFRACLDLP